MSQIKKKSATTCALLDIEPTRHSTVEKKLLKQFKKLFMMVDVCRLHRTEKMTACMRACNG